MIRNAKDLSPDQKAVIENFLGRPILEDEAISVRAFEQPALSDDRKRELTEQLKNYFAEVDAQRMPGSPEEAEDIINEAIRSVVDTTILVRANGHRRSFRALRHFRRSPPASDLCRQSQARRVHA